MKTLICLIVVWALAAPLAVAAQERNAPVPACTQAERNETNQLIIQSDILGRLLLASTQLQFDGSSELITVVIELDSLHREYWHEIAPTFPECAFGLRMRAILGRFVDELLGSASMMALAAAMDAQGESALANTFTEAAFAHMEQLDAFGDEIAPLLGH